MNRHDLSRAAWRTSSYSGTNGSCVEVANNLPGVVAVRDSRDRGGPVLVVGPDEWRVFIDRVKSGSH
jgi:Domain of unknown function (DUF397)